MMKASGTASSRPPIAVLAPNMTASAMAPDGPGLAVVPIAPSQGRPPAKNPTTKNVPASWPINRSSRWVWLIVGLTPSNSVGSTPTAFSRCP